MNTKFNEKIDEIIAMIEKLKLELSNAPVIEESEWVDSWEDSWC